MERTLLLRISSWGLLAASLILVWSLFIQSSLAQRPPDKVFAPWPGGYVFVECPEVFDALNDEGITIEFWFYLTDAPSKWRDRWVLLSRSGSYSFYVRGRRTIADGWPSDDPVGTVNLSCRTFNSGRADAGIQNPLRRWYHFAFQSKVAIFENRTSHDYAEFFDGTASTSGFGGLASIAYDPDEMLFIGGRPKYESLKGWIDEVRVSDKWRYTPGVRFKPSREFNRDRHTLALWHFDEGPQARRYEDDSGNGHTLLAGGTLPVNPAGRAATVWGRLRDRVK